MNLILNPMSKALGANTTLGIHGHIYVLNTTKNIENGKKFADSYFQSLLGGYRIHGGASQN